MSPLWSSAKNIRPSRANTRSLTRCSLPPAVRWPKPRTKNSVGRVGRCVVASTGAHCTPALVQLPTQPWRPTKKLLP
ncbi:MAG: hypothetical protein IPF99_24125 [Deltaproteobacteria bacterium]|nr:hypothetical protein [Deltaproteobacteria bacterium]